MEEVFIYLSPTIACSEAAMLAARKYFDLAGIVEVEKWLTFDNLALVKDMTGEYQKQALLKAWCCHPEITNANRWPRITRAVNLQRSEDGNWVGDEQNVRFVHRYPSALHGDFAIMSVTGFNLRERLEQIEVAARQSTEMAFIATLHAVTQYNHINILDEDEGLVPWA
jgi:hypothetical protein